MGSDSEDILPFGELCGHCHLTLSTPIPMSEPLSGAAPPSTARAGSKACLPSMKGVREDACGPVFLAQPCLGFPISPPHPPLKEALKRISRHTRMRQGSLSSSC